MCDNEPKTGDWYGRAAVRAFTGQFIDLISRHRKAKNPRNYSEIRENTKIITARWHNGREYKEYHEHEAGCGCELCLSLTRTIIGYTKMYDCYRICPDHWQSLKNEYRQAVDDCLIKELGTGGTSQEEVNPQGGRAS
jgi:hypothetical protein